MKRAFEGQENRWIHVLRKTWEDEEFKKKLFGDPIPVLKEHGIEFPDGAKVNLVEGSEGAEGLRVNRAEANENEITVALPPAGSIELSDEDLEKVAGGLIDGPVDQSHPD